MNALLKNPAVNLMMLLLGLALQAIAAFEFEAIDPMRVGLMGLASSLLVLSDWRSLSKVNAAAFLGAKPFLILVALSVPVSCAWMRSVTTDAVDCAVEAGKELFIKLLPEARIVLADPVWENVEAGLANLVSQYGHDFVWCLVARAKSDAMMLGSDGSGDNGQVTVNAERWMGE